MKIDQLNVISFGKLNNLELNFSGKFNLIYGLNESGKSTLQNFIYSAFFGAKRDKAENSDLLRDYYFPWDHSSFEGTLLFSAKDGKRYKIFRNFEKTKEKLELIDLANGVNIIGNFAESGGRPKESLFADTLLGVSREVFRDTVFMNQARVAQLENPDKLSDVMQAMATTGTEDTTSINAVAKLEKAIDKAGTERASTKEFFKVNSLIMALGKKKAEIEAKREELKDVFLKKKALTEEKNNLAAGMEKSSEIVHLSALKSLRQKMLGLKNVLQAIEDAKKELEKVTSDISGNEAKAAAIKEKFAKIISPETGSIKKPEEFEEIKTEFSKIETLDKEKILRESRLKEAELKGGKLKNKTKNILNFAALAVFILAVSLISYFIFKNKFVLYFTFAAALLNCAAGVFIVLNLTEFKNNARDTEVLRNSIPGIDDEKKRSNERISEFFISLGVKNYDELRRQFEDIKRFDDIINGKRETMASVEKRLKSEIDRYNRDRTGVNDYISRMQFKGIVLTDDIERCVSVVEGKIAEEAVRLNIDPDKVTDEEDNIRNSFVDKLNEIERQISHLNGIEKQATIDLPEISEVEDELSQAEERKSQIELYIQALGEAKKTLEEISADYHRDVFAPELTAYTSEIINKITKKYSNVFFDKDFNIRVEVSDAIGVKDASNLSLGTREQFYLALKAALGKYLSSKGETLPLILDDVLTNFDVERRKQTFEFMLDLSGSTQIIIFTSDINQYNQVKDILNSRGSAFNEEPKGEFSILTS